MRESLRVLIIDDEDRNLEPLRQSLDQFENVFSRYTTTSEEAEFAIGSHFHLAIVNIAARTIDNTKKTLLPTPTRSPLYFAALFKEHPEYRTYVIPIDIRSEDAKAKNDHLQGMLCQLRNDIFAIIATPTTILADVTQVMRHIPDLAPLRKRPVPIPPPPPPLPPAAPELPLRFDHLKSKIEGSMDDQIRDAFESFKASREALR